LLTTPLSRVHPNVTLQIGIDTLTAAGDQNPLMAMIRPQASFASRQ